MKFEFGKYTEVTDLAKEINPEYENSGYSRIFICLDTNDFWLSRILPNTNKDYDEAEGYLLLERDKIPKESKSETLTLPRVKEILEEDDFSNWDYEEYEDINDAIEAIDGAYGINNLKAEA